MFQTKTYQKWEGHEKQPNQKDREVYEIEANQKAIEWIQTQLQQKHWEEHEKKEESRQKTKNSVSIVNIKHLNYSDYDIPTMVEQILKKNEFSDDSSIFVVVSSLDNDAGNSSDGQNSTICIQMSQNITNWKKIISPVEHDQKQRRNVATTLQGVKISAKGKRFFMEGLPNKRTSFKHGNQMRKDNEKKSTQNKLCQISTPNGIVERSEHRCNVVSTDTTADRPCFCNPATTQYPHYNPNDRYVTNVTSKLITPLLEDGTIGNPYHIRWGMKEQESVMSVKLPVTPCRIPPCRIHHHDQAPTKYVANPSQCPANSAQHHAYPAQHHGNPALYHAKACSAQEGIDLSQACQCSPETTLGLLKLEFKGDKKQHMQSTGCGECPQVSKTQAPGPPRAPQSKEQQSELYKIEPTLNKCHCGPTPEIMQIEMGQTKRKQVRIMATPSSSNVGTCTEHKSFRWFKSGKKSIKKITCECPQRKPEPEPEPNLIPYHTLDSSYQKDEFENTLKNNSLETLRVSGFINKKKRPPPEIQLEYTVEDALRYYAVNRSIVAEQQAKMDGMRTPPYTYNSELEASPSDSQDDEGPFRGLKFKIGGKGSASQGLADICCFDLPQESFTSW